MQNATLTEWFGKTWSGQSKKGGAAEMVPWYKWKIVHSRLRAHSIAQERAARWIYHYANYRFELFWGVNPFLDAAMAITTSAKSASRKLSKDESVYDSSASKGKGILQRKAGNHDYGIMVRKVCGSMRGTGEILRDAISTGTGSFVGAGYPRSCWIEPGAKYYKGGPYQYFGKGYDLAMRLLTKTELLVGQGHEVYLDSYFLRNPVALLDHMRQMHTNIAGTVRRDARNLPVDRRNMIARVKEYERGQYESMVSANHGALYTMSKSRKECGMVSNFHGDEEEGNLRRYDEKEGDFTEINTSAVVADYNKGGFNNVDCNDSIVYSATKYKRKTSHLWRTAMEVPIFKLLPGAAWLLWRTIHPAKTTTYREFLSAIVSTTIDAPFLTYVRKRKDTNLRGRLRFTEQPISQLRPQQIRAEFGPQRKYDISTPVRGRNEVSVNTTVCSIYQKKQKLE